MKNILKQFNKQSSIEKRVDELSGDEIVNLGKQIDNAKPWFEPKRILPKILNMKKEIMR